LKAAGRTSFRPEPSFLSPVVEYHGLARRYLLPLGFLMRPLLDGGTLGRPDMKYLLPESNEDQISRLVDLAMRLEDAPPESEIAAELLRRYSELCGRNLLHREFLDFHGAYSVREFVERTLVPDHLFDPTVDDAVLLELIAELQTVDGTRVSETRYWIQRDYWQRILEVQTANPGLGEMISNSPGASPVDVLEKTRAGHPVRL
jgi:hypothetical protein